MCFVAGFLWLMRDGFFFSTVQTHVWWLFPCSFLLFIFGLPTCRNSHLITTFEYSLSSLFKYSFYIRKMVWWYHLWVPMWYMREFCILHETWWIHVRSHIKWLINVVQKYKLKQHYYLFGQDMGEFCACCLKNKRLLLSHQLSCKMIKNWEMNEQYLTKTSDGL